MAQLEKTKLKGRGGSGRGQGRKLGVKSKAKLSTIKTREEALEYFKKQTFGIVGKIFNSQMIVAQGTHKMLEIIKDEGIPHYETVRDTDRMDELIQHGTYGKDYIVTIGTLPDFRAGDAILNRALGKPTESVELSGKDGAPLLIKLNE